MALPTIAQSLGALLKSARDILLRPSGYGGQVMQQWLGRTIDPHVFDKALVNELMAAVDPLSANFVGAEGRGEVVLRFREGIIVLGTLSYAGQVGFHQSG